MDGKITKTQAFKISAVSIAINLFLAVLKLLAGFLGHSKALIADAIHSASDVLTTVIVMISLFISAKPADHDHQYGHQKFENIAAFVLGVLLAHVGIKLGYNGISGIISGDYKTLAVPGLITLAAAVISIVAKEIMYQITMAVAKKENSKALKADAWHHRSDALSSIGSLAGVVFARLGFPIMDSIACIVICVLILKTAAEIVIDAVKSLTDSSCDPKKDDAVRKTVMSVEGVLNIDLLKTRAFGSGFYVDVEISVDSQKSLLEAHNIAETVHDAIETSFGDVLHCMVHVNPYLCDKN